MSGTGHGLESFPQLPDIPFSTSFFAFRHPAARQVIVAVTDTNGSVRLFEFETGKSMASLTRFRRPVMPLMALQPPRWKRLAITRDGLDVCLWDLRVLQQELTSLGLSAICAAPANGSPSPPSRHSMSIAGKCPALRIGTDAGKLWQRTKH